MALAFNEEQRSLKDTAKDFASSRSPIEAFRKLRDEKDETGFNPEIWSEMIELGWSGMTFPEAYGGFDFGFMGLAGCMEEFGRTLVASPLLSSIVLSGSTILFAGNEAQKTTLLPRIISGEILIALACDEGLHHHPARMELEAHESENGYILNGKKTMVVDGHVADKLIVAARTAGYPGDESGITLFLVDTKKKGITTRRTHLIDSRGYARIDFDHVEISAEDILGEVNNGFEPLVQALDRGRICLAAEMFGGMQEIFERTIDYLKERKQFGHIIGEFQALQHRAAHMYTLIEMCRSSLMNSLNALENNAENHPQLISGTKALISETYELVSNEAVQMHGGIGVTDELDIGLFLKRARVSAELLGSASFHYDRYATLEGF
ncbi:MAG: acyl-CoA/acyl-ACP dehydrogenase [Pseudomonadales bacterium]|nr:acyl-CoA/acyl-ACP dehydrogenase [Pseudomonadales bacterium]